MKGRIKLSNVFLPPYQVFREMQFLYHRKQADCYKGLRPFALRDKSMCCPALTYQHACHKKHKHILELLQAKEFRELNGQAF